MRILVSINFRKFLQLNLIFMETNSQIKEEKVRKCCVCDSKIYGRSDKVFCNTTCKNKYHSSLRKHNQSVSVQTINKLNRNYQILCLLLGEDVEKFEISKLELIKLGFQFSIVSGIEVNNYELKFSVYEFTFKIKTNQIVEVTRESNQSQISPYVYKRWTRTYCEKEKLLT